MSKTKSDLDQKLNTILMFEFLFFQKLDILHRSKDTDNKKSHLFIF